MKRRDFVKSAALLGTGAGIGQSVWSTGAIAAEQEAKTKTFTLWQLPSQADKQIMSYVFKTSNGKIVVLDGGYQSDAGYLRGFLAALGNRVDSWILSHPHPDHVDAVTEILKRPGKLKIDRFYGSFPDPAWAKKTEPKYAVTMEQFQTALETTPFPFVEVKIGDTLDVDGIRIEILGVKNPEITHKAFNNSSVVFRMLVGEATFLFTGDLGAEGGRKLLASPQGAKLKADYLQVAHHGQDGPDRDFYQAVAPSHCLWPTPIWIWENVGEKGPGTGPYTTFEVRRWMEELGVKNHYLLFEGLQKIEIPMAG